MSRIGWRMGNCPTSPSEFSAKSLDPLCNGERMWTTFLFSSLFTLFGGWIIILLYDFLKALLIKQRRLKLISRINHFRHADEVLGPVPISLDYCSSSPLVFYPTCQSSLDSRQPIAWWNQWRLFQLATSDQRMGKQFDIRTDENGQNFGRCFVFATWEFQPMNCLLRLGRRHLRLQYCIIDPVFSRHKKCVSHRRETPNAQS